MNLAEVINDYATVVICCASNSPLVTEMILQQDIKQNKAVNY